MDALRDHAAPFLSFMERAGYMADPPRGDDNDFVFGNPQDMPLPGFVSALQHQLTPRDTRWFAYKMNEAVATEPVARSLSEHDRREYRAQRHGDDAGCVRSDRVALKALLEPGDEVLYSRRRGSSTRC